MRSTIALVMLMPLISACATTRFLNNCPDLRKPPAVAVDALEQADDPVIDQWVVDLDKHYQKLDVC